MAWTHYTAPLADGEMLTAGMRRELWEAIEERRALVWPAAEIDFTYLDTLEAAGLASALIRVRDLVGAGWAVTTLHDVLSAIAQRTGGAFAPFKKDTTTADLSWSTSADWQADVAAAIGLTSAALALVWAQSRGVSLREYWNSIRAGITLLKYVRFAAAGSIYSRIQRGNDTTPPYTVAGAVAAYPVYLFDSVLAYEFAQADADSAFFSVTASITAAGVVAVLPDLDCVTGMVVRYNVTIAIDAFASVAAPVASLPVSLSLGSHHGSATSGGGASEVHAIDLTLDAADRGATLPFALRFRAYDTPADFLAFSLSGDEYAEAHTFCTPDKTVGVATPAFQYS